MTKAQRKKIQDSIVASLEKGNKIMATLQAVGLHYSTYQDWSDPESPRYSAEFSENLKKAFAQGVRVLEEVCLDSIMNAATASEKPAWQAAAWMLERTQPKKYALNTKIEHSGEIKQSYDLSTLSEEEKAVLLKLARKNGDKTE